MNLPAFLHEVDAHTSKLSQKDLEDFIHEIARTLPEGVLTDIEKAEGL